MISIVYEDNHLLVAVKPPNMPSQEDVSGDRDILSLLKDDIKKRYNKPGNVYLGLVQRLDRPVGGLMVFARTSKAASRLSEAVRTRSIDKQYWAVVRGKPQAAKDRLEHYLRKDAQKNTVSVVSSDAPGAKQAILTYEVLETAGDLSLLNVVLETGRPHQIRVQLAHIGCPLYGDQRYGASVNKPGQQIALWSRQLSFVHPVRKEPLSFQSNPPNQYPWDVFTRYKQLKS